MVSFEEALAAVRRRALSLPPEEVPIEQARGRLLTQDVPVPSDFPRFDASAMDGFAVGGPGTEWRVVGEARAGRTADYRLALGEAVRITTGAPTPEGAFAVVPVEDAREEGGTVRAKSPPLEGRHVRRRGEEARAGDPGLPAGLRVSPAVAGTLAAFGLRRVRVSGAPRVGLLATGDELATPGEALGAAGAYESNTAAIGADMRARGATVELARCPDDPCATEEAVRRLAEGNDVVATVGGISAGRHDYVRRAVRALGCQVEVEGVALKPGKPFCFGVLPGGKLWFGLPGNPLSAWATYWLFVRCAWEHGPAFRPVRLAEGVSRPAGREEFVPFRFEGDLARLLPPVGSHSVTALAMAAGLARVPGEAERLEAGEAVWATCFGEESW